MMRIRVSTEASLSGASGLHAAEGSSGRSGIRQRRGLSNAVGLGHDRLERPYDGLTGMMEEGSN